MPVTRPPVPKEPQTFLTLMYTNAYINNLRQCRLVPIEVIVLDNEEEE